MKRFMSFLLALVLLVSAFPVTARAAEKEEKKIEEIVVPVASPEDVEIPNADNYYTSTSSAGASIRSALKSRNTTINVQYKLSNSYWNEPGLDSIVDKIMAAAWAETGKGNEGDYLRHHIRTYTWSANGNSYDGRKTWYATIKISVTYTNTASQESVVASEVSSLLSSLNLSGTRYQKLKKIYDWVCNNVDVTTYGGSEIHSAYGALHNRQASTLGFTTLMYRLCREAGLVARIITSANGDHAWIIANTGNLFYNMDATMDAIQNTRNYFLVNNSTIGLSRASEYNTSSFNSSYPMGSYNYNPSTAATIVTQPKSVSVANGKTAKVTVGATGEGLTYQWYVKNPGSSSYSKSSATGNSYSCPMDASRNGRKVYCKITDRFGNSVSTNDATLSMSKSTVKITAHPQSVTVAKGATAKVTVKATGDGLTYKWYYKDKGASSYTYTSSFKSNTYQVEMTAARNGRRVLCRVYDKYGNVVQSDSALLSMKQTTTKNTVKITTQPKSVVVSKGATAKVTVKATGDGLTYKWYYKDAGASKFSLTNSFKSNTYSVQMTDARNGRQIYCKITDKYGNTATTNTVTLSMEGGWTVFKGDQTFYMANGDRAQLKVTCDNPSVRLSYKWYFKDKGSSSYSLTKTFTGDTYIIDMTPARNGRKVYCQVTDQYGNTQKTGVVTFVMG